MARKKTKPKEEISVRDAGLIREAVKKSAVGELDWLDRIIQGEGYRRADFRGLRAREVADLFGVSAVAVGLWVTRDGCPKGVDGRYDLREVLRWHRRQAMQKSPEAAQSKSMERKRRAEAEMTEMKLKEMKGELVSRVDVDRGRVARIQVVKRALLRMPRSLAPVLVGMDMREIEAYMGERIRDIIGEFAGGK